MTFASLYSNDKRFYYLRKKLRKDQTGPEEYLWKRIKGKQLGYKFRRQFQINYYIVDFYCHPLKLVIELDGEYHDTEENKIKDKKRDAYLRSQKYTVLRFTNEEVCNELDAVLKKILQACENKNSSL